MQLIGEVRIQKSLYADFIELDDSLSGVEFNLYGDLLSFWFGSLSLSSLSLSVSLSLSLSLVCSLFSLSFSPSDFFAFFFFEARGTSLLSCGLCRGYTGCGLRWKLGV